MHVPNRLRSGCGPGGDDLRIEVAERQTLVAVVLKCLLPEFSIGRPYCFRRPRARELLPQVQIFFHTAPTKACHSSLIATKLSCN